MEIIGFIIIEFIFSAIGWLCLLIWYRDRKKIKKIRDEEYAGKFGSDETDVTYTVIVQDGKLSLARKKAKNIALAPTFADNFWNDDFGYFKFTRDQGHRINGMLYTSSWIRRLRFKKT